MTNQQNQINLLGLDQSQLVEFFHQIGEKPFRAAQIMKWLYQFSIIDFSKMSNISKNLQLKLIELSSISLPEIVHQQNSLDGTIKWLIRLNDGNCIETVYIPEEGRGTLCVSSQVGCALACTFCSTARQGFNRNLSSSEMIAQVWIANQALGKTPKGERLITNVVFMGMGEPLLNEDNLITTINILLDDNAYGLSKRRVTISTAGVIPALRRLQENCDVSLALSLHAPNNKLREQLVPLNKKYPIEEVLQACRDYFSGDTKLKQFTIEYVLLDNFNDHLSHARDLAKLLKNIPCKINLIPFNPFENSGFKTSTPDKIDKFQKVLMNAGIVTMKRKTRGDDIDAACGQLAGRVDDKSGRTLGGIKEYKRVVNQ